MAQETYIKYPSKLKMNNPEGAALTNAEWVAGHHSVATIDDLYTIYDFILSPTTYEGYASDGSDAIGELWYVRSEKVFYQLIDWSNRKQSTGWAKANIKSASNTGDSSNDNTTGDGVNLLTSITVKGDGTLKSTSYTLSNLQDSITYVSTYANNIGNKLDSSYTNLNKAIGDAYTWTNNTYSYFTKYNDSSYTNIINAINNLSSPDGVISTYMDDIYKKFGSLSGNVKSIDGVTPNDESVDVSYTIQSPGSAEYEKDMAWTSTDTKFTIPGATESTAGVLSSQDKIYINSIVEGDKPLASISISGNWIITPTTTLYSNLTSNSMTIDYGYTASWSGTWKWSASSSQKVPESCSGAWGTTLTSNNTASSSLAKSNITSAQSWNQSIYAKKRGLVVSNNKVTLMTSENATNDSASASVSINFTYCKFVGYCTNAQPTSSDILNSFKQIARGTNNQLTTQSLSPGETEYVFYAYPSNFSDIKSAKLGGVEEIIDAWTKKTNVAVTMPVSSTTIVYKVYVSTKTGAYKSQTVTFS